MKKIVLTFNGAEEKRKLNAETIANYVGGEVYTGGTNCNENFCNILGLDDDILFFEDDVRNINLPKILETIEKNDDIFINFHYLPQPKVSSLLSGSEHAWNQCLYIPKHVGRDILRASVEYRLQHEHDNRYANLIKFGLEKGKHNLYAVVPNLVRHYYNWESTI